MSAIHLQGIAKARGEGARRVSALSDVTLRVEAGEVVLLEGPSGSGKTTLLAIAGGLLAPDAGTVSIAGRALGDLDAAGLRRHRARTVGFVLQRPCLLAELGVRDNVLLAASLAGVPPERARRETQALLEALGIGALAERRPAELSGGQEQRAAVARALVHRPAVLLADEPTASLDGASGAAVGRLLVELAAERGTAVLVATHDARLRSLAPTRLHLEDGRLAETRA
jgi:putative ABC transport system ATP-binding protein